MCSNKTTAEMNLALLQFQKWYLHSASWAMKFWNCHFHMDPRWYSNTFMSPSTLVSFHNYLITLSCNKVTTTQIQIEMDSSQILAMINLTPIISRAKSKWYKSKKVRKLALDSQLLIVQILTNDIQVLIFCLSYIITTVTLRKLQNSKNTSLIDRIDFVSKVV